MCKWRWYQPTYTTHTTYTTYSTSCIWLPHRHQYRSINGYGNPNYQQIQALGASTVRIEYQDGQGFAKYDPVIAGFVSHGVQVLLIIDYASQGGRPSSSGGDWNAFISSYAQKCTQIAQHYGSQVFAYEIWNEPDLPSVGNVDASVYGLLLKAAYNAIKSVSSAYVVTGGFASGNPGYVTQAIQSAGRLYADVLGVHTYGQRPSANWPTSTWGFGVLSSLINGYYNSANLPIWITEMGTDDMRVQADFPSQFFAAASATPHVAGVWWFCWSDGMVNNFGVLDKSGNQKPSYNSFRSYATGH